MNKKFLTLIGMLTCVFMLTACGESERVSEVETQKIESAVQYAPNMVTLFSDYLCQDNPFVVSDYTLEEVEYLCEQCFGIKVDGYAVANAVTSFDSALETIGGIVEIGETEVKVDGKQMICEVEVTGEKKNAKAEIILSNDMFLKLESASLNPVSTTGDLMAKAALNTLIGMGTVFLVLILISVIISCFSLIPKLQAAVAKRKEKKAAFTETSGIDNAVAQISAQEEGTVDDLELIAVISAAIAASEGARGTDGFVVRSIRRIR